MTSFPLNLQKKWIKLNIESKYIFYNPEDNLISYHPPFPLEYLSMFLKYYQLPFSEHDLLLLLKGKTKKKNKLQAPSQNNIRNSDYKELDTSPITDPQKLQDILNMVKYEPIDRILNHVFHIKYKILPNLQYTQKDKTKPQKCMIKVKDKVLFIGNEKETKALARKDAEKTALKILIPSIYDEIRASKHKNKQQKDSKSKVRLNLLGYKRAPLFRNEIDLKNTNRNFDIQTSFSSHKLHPSIRTNSVNINNNIIINNSDAKKNIREEDYIDNCVQFSNNEKFSDSKSNSDDSSISLSSSDSDSLSSSQLNLSSVILLDKNKEELEIDNRLVVSKFLKEFKYTPYKV